MWGEVGSGGLPPSVAMRRGEEPPQSRPNGTTNINCSRVVTLMLEREAQMALARSNEVASRQGALIDGLAPRPFSEMLKQVGGIDSDCWLPWLRALIPTVNKALHWLQPTTLQDGDAFLDTMALLKPWFYVAYMFFSYKINVNTDNCFTVTKRYLSWWIKKILNFDIRASLFKEFTNHTQTVSFRNK